MSPFVWVHVATCQRCGRVRAYCVSSRDELEGRSSLSVRPENTPSLV